MRKLLPMLSLGATVFALCPTVASADQIHSELPGNQPGTVCSYAGNATGAALCANTADRYGNGGSRSPGLPPPPATTTFDISFSGIGCSVCESGSAVMVVNNQSSGGDPAGGTDIVSFNGSFSGGAGNGTFTMGANPSPGGAPVVWDSNTPGMGFQYNDVFYKTQAAGSFLDLYGILLQTSGGIQYGNIFFQNGAYWLYLDGYSEEIAFNVSQVPEPASLALFGSGLVAAGAAFRRRRRKLASNSAAAAS